ncbi:MAG: hypothetical protein ACQEXB_18140 [Bacillota bacterium]
MDARTWLTLSIVGYSLAGALFIVTCILFFKMRILAIIGDLSGRTAAKQIQEIRELNAISGQKRHQPSAFNLERGSLTEPVSGPTGRRGPTGMRLNPKSKRLEEQGPTGMRLNPKSKRLEEQGPTGMPLNQKLKRLDGQGQTAMGLTQKPIRLEEQGQTMGGQEYNSSETEFLASNETEVLGDWGTEVLVDESTEVLDQSTEVLSDEEIEDLNQGTEVLLNENTDVLTDVYETTVLNPTVELEKEKIDEPLVEFKIVKDIKVIHTDEVI